MVGKLLSVVLFLVLLNVYSGQAMRSFDGGYTRWDEGRCAINQACEKCADDEKQEVWTMWFPWQSSTPPKNQTRIVCCHGCRGKLVAKQGARTYTCMCRSEIDTCGRDSECDLCDPKYVTKVNRKSYCCQGCKPASLSFKWWGYDRMGLCSCNE